MLCLRVPALGAVVILAGLAACNDPITSDVDAEIRGVVLDLGTGAPIPNVLIRTAPISDEVRTGEDGGFVLRRNVRLNTLYRVTAEVEGYAPETLDVTPRVDREANLSFRLRLLTVCSPGAVRCSQGEVGIETCIGRGEQWQLTECGEGEVCDSASPGCIAGRTLTVTAVGGFVLSTPTGISCNPTCSATYSDGTAVSLTAQPFQNGSFLGWSGACSEAGSELTCELVMSADLEAGAEFTQSTYPVQVDFRSDGAGEVRLQGRRDDAPAEDVCRDDCTLRFDRETSVGLTATPDEGSEFAGWGRACSGSSPSCSVQLDDPAGAEVRVRFDLPRRTLEVTRDGPGAGRVTSAPDGIDCGSDCTEEFLLGTEVVLSASAEAGSELSAWGGACASAGTDPTCTVTTDQARTVSVTFEGQAFALTVNRTGSGQVTSDPSGIDCGADCGESFGLGQVVTLTASATPGHEFVGWGGDCSAAGADDTCEVTMDANRTVDASFEEVRVEVAVALTGGGQVVSDPGGIDCPGVCTADFASGSTVDLTATPDAGQALEAWGGDCGTSGRDAVCTLTVGAARSVTAAFVDFYLAPLAADGACTTLLRFDPAAPLQDACGGQGVTEVGTWSVGSSRVPLLVDAYGTTVEGDALELSDLLPAPPRATVQLTVRRSGQGHGSSGFGVLLADRDPDDQGPGLELLAHDDGRVELRTWTSSVASSSVATATGTLSVGTWAHVAAVVEPSRLEIFVDGASAGQALDPVEWTASSSTAVIGAHPSATGPTDSVAAEIDEVRVSDVARY